MSKHEYPKVRLSILLVKLKAISLHFLITTDLLSPSVSLYPGSLLRCFGPRQEIEAADRSETICNGKGSSVECVTTFGDRGVDLRLLLEEDEGVTVIASRRSGLPVRLKDLTCGGDCLLARHVYDNPVEPLPCTLLGASQGLDVKDTGIRHH